MTINGEVGESMILNVIHETDDEGRPTVVVHFPAFSVVGSGIDLFDAWPTTSTTRWQLSLRWRSFGRDQSYSDIT